MSQARTLAARIVLAAAVFVPPMLAQATSPACGSYTHDSGYGGERSLIIESSATATLRGRDSAPRHLGYRIEAGTLRFYDLDYGFAETWQIETDGRLRSEMEETYVLAAPAACAAPPPAPAGSCRADLGVCLQGWHDADPARLTSWCDQESLPFACAGLIDSFQREADERAKNDGGAAQAPPPECREGNPAFSAAACRTKVDEAIARALADTFKGMYADDRPLPAPRLERVQALCAQSGSPKVCDKAAEKLWTAGRYLDARAALAVACERGEEPEACKTLDPLRELTAADFSVPMPVALPCGQYVAATGLMRELAFGDEGLVEGAFGTRLRARLEDGRIRIRHDKGGDFVFRAIGGGRLLGVDSWNHYAVYHHQAGGAAHCAPPRRFTERPLAQDCPEVGRPGGAEACCDAGKLQGCNALGNTRALAGDWSGARRYYQRICAAGVRSGCENLIQVYVQIGDEDVIGALEALCRDNPDHVACDVLETSNREALDVGRALEQALREAAESADSPAQDDAP